jgi:hypothetical protein
MLAERSDGEALSVAVPKEGRWPGGRQPIPTCPLLRHGVLPKNETVENVRAQPVLARIWHDLERRNAQARMTVGSERMGGTGLEPVTPSLSIGLLAFRLFPPVSV